MTNMTKVQLSQLRRALVLQASVQDPQPSHSAASMAKETNSAQLLDFLCYSVKAISTVLNRVIFIWIKQSVSVTSYIKS